MSSIRSGGAFITLLIGVGRGHFDSACFLRRRSVWGCWGYVRRASRTGRLVVGESRAGCAEPCRAANASRPARSTRMNETTETTSPAEGGRPKLSVRTLALIGGGVVLTLVVAGFAVPQL